MAAWIPLGAILVLVTRLSGHLSIAESVAVTVPPAIALAFVCLTPWYMCRSLPLRSAAPVKIVGHHLAAAVILSGGVMLIGRLAASPLGIEESFAGAVPLLAVIVSMIYLMSVTLHYAAMELEASRQSEILAREAQLRALKSQVNPHFLFNSLNSISALTSIDAGEARRMCIRLSDFLRTSLRLGEKVVIPFAEEMALTRMYLDVEQVRFGDRLRLKQDVEPACSDCDIPALLIQPLVENAVKHGIAMMAAGGEIRISGRRERDFLLFAISNPFDPEAPSPGRNGLGLRNIRERLEARYGNAARMEIKVDEDLYRVALTIPVRTPR
jgi:two-component system sensor histidine kinase AlgZ